MAIPHEMEAAFVGRIAAGATHEFRNILAIVKESAGLIGDLVEVGGPGGMPDREKVLRAVARIEAQVGRGADLAGALNRLAHALEKPAGATVLSREVEQAALLGERFVRRRERRLCVRPGAGDLFSKVSSLGLWMAIVAAVDLCVEQVPEGGAVLVEAEGLRGEPAVRFGGEGLAGGVHAVRADGIGSAGLRDLVAELGGWVETTAEGSGFLVVFPAGSS